MEVIELKINAIEVFEIKNKQHWINSFPGALPKLPTSEKYIFVDSRGKIATCGEDFTAAEKYMSYPIKVYLPVRISNPSNPVYYYNLLSLFK